MNCHAQVLKDDARLALVRDSAASGAPIPWVQIHKLPDYVYFNHSAHVNRGVSCVECHGRIDLMDEVAHAKPLSMAFCLDCHRDPVSRVRPLDKITDLSWQASSRQKQLETGSKIVQEWGVQSLENCSTCHR
jgi:formate-dependent nitrite reductase cytochrome c552 subunit